MKNGYLERATEITEDCFVFPAAITVEKDKSIKIALDSSKLNEATIKRKAQMQNMEELISRRSRKISEVTEGEIMITKLDFGNAYGQLQLDEQTKRLCIFTVKGGGNSHTRLHIRRQNHLSGTDRQNTSIQTPHL